MKYVFHTNSRLHTDYSIDYDENTKHVRKQHYCNSSMCNDKDSQNTFQNAFK